MHRQLLVLGLLVGLLTPAFAWRQRWSFSQYSDPTQADAHLRTVRQGKTDLAVRCHRRAYLIDANILGLENAVTALNLNKLGGALMAHG